MPGFCVAAAVPVAVAASANLPTPHSTGRLRQLIVDDVLFHERQELNDPAVAVTLLTGGDRADGVPATLPNAPYFIAVFPRPVVAVQRQQWRRRGQRQALAGVVVVLQRNRATA